MSAIAYLPTADHVNASMSATRSTNSISHEYLWDCEAFLLRIAFSPTEGGCRCAVLTAEPSHDCCALAIVSRPLPWVMVWRSELHLCLYLGFTLNPKSLPAHACCTLLVFRAPCLLLIRCSKTFSPALIGERPLRSQSAASMAVRASLRLFKWFLLNCCRQDQSCKQHPVQPLETEHVNKLMLVPKSP